MDATTRLTVTTHATQHTPRHSTRACAAPVCWVGMGLMWLPSLRLRLPCFFPTAGSPAAPMRCWRQVRAAAGVIIIIQPTAPERANTYAASTSAHHIASQVCMHAHPNGHWLPVWQLALPCRTCKDLQLVQRSAMCALRLAHARTCTCFNSAAPTWAWQVPPRPPSHHACAHRPCPHRPGHAAQGGTARMHALDPRIHGGQGEVSETCCRRAARHPTRQLAGQYAPGWAADGPPLTHHGPSCCPCPCHSHGCPAHLLHALQAVPAA